MKYVVVDIGSTHVKAAVLDPEKNMVCDTLTKNSPSRNPNLPHFMFEVPAEQYLDLILDVMELFTKTYPDVEGLLLSTQMHGFVLEAPGHEATYISWQDTRCLEKDASGKTYLESLRALIPAEQMSRFGVMLKPSLGLCNLYAKLSQEGSQVSEKTLYTLGSFIIHRMTGNNICHLSNAAPLGFADVEKREWDVQLLDALGIKNLSLPQIADEDFRPCGEFEMGTRQIRVFPDYGDQQVSILGCFAGAQDAVINIATASQVSVFSNRFEKTNYECRPYFEGAFIQTISNMPAGRHIEVLMRFFADVYTAMTGNAPEPSVLWKLTETAESDTEGISVESTFFPTEHTAAGGAVTGIRDQNLRVKTLLSALYTDMAEKYWKNIQHLKTPEQIGALICAGGVSWHQPSLVKRIRLLTGKPVSLSAYPDEALAGLMRIAKCCSGNAERLADTDNLKGAIVWQQKKGV